MRIRFLGQSGFLIEGERRIVVDPFLGDLEDEAERRKFPRVLPPPCRPEELGPVDAAFITHHHGDHLHLETLRRIAALSPGCVFVGSTSCIERLRLDGHEPARLNIVALPGWSTHAGIRMFAVPARHYEFSTRPDVVFDYFGYVFEIDGRRVYHAGDTIPFSGLTELLSSLEVSVALLPINGRDAAREGLGIVGNLTTEEAAALTVNSSIRTVVPCHFDTFAKNAGDSEEFLSLLERMHASVEAWVPESGAWWTPSPPGVRS